MKEKLNFQQKPFLIQSNLKGVQKMNMDSFSKIIGSINTPLALAALSILVIGSILYANARGAERPYLVKYGFGLSALFGLLAIVGFFADSYFNQIFLAEGIVVGDDNKIIEGAFVDMFESGQSVTGRDGRYKVPIFRKSTLPSYNLRVQKPGYADWAAKDVAGPYPVFQQPVLNAKKFGIDNISIAADITAAVYLGAPETFLNFSVANETISPVSIQGLILRLTSPEGMTVNLYANQIIDAASGPRNFSPLVINPLQDFSVQIAFHDWPVMQNAMSAADRSQVMIDYGCAPGGDNNLIRSNPQLEELFDRNFRWSEGTWTARLNVTTPKSTLTKSFRFSLSSYDVNGFKEMKYSYKQCAGLIFANHYVSNGTMRSMVVVSIEDAR